MTIAKPDRVASPQPGRVGAVGSTASAGSGVTSAQRRLPEIGLSALLVLLGLAILVPFLGLAAYTLHTREAEAREMEIQRISDLATELAYAVDRELEGHISTARVLTRSRYLQRRDIPAFAVLAGDAAGPAEGHFVLIDRSYQQLVNTRVAFGRPLPKTADPRKIEEVFSTGEVRVGDLGIRAITGQLLFSLNLPIEIDGEVEYVLSFVPHQDVMPAVIEQTYRPEGWQASVVDGTGRIVARSRLHDEFFGKPVSADIWDITDPPSGTMQSVDLEGNDVVTAYRASAISDWRAFVWAPQALLQEPVKAAQKFLAFLVLLTASGSVVAAYLFSRLIRKPAERVVKAANALAEGEPVVFQPSIMREANIVGRALTEASCEIKSREGALQEAQDRRRVIMQEMSHRTKNMLTVIQAIASQSARTSPDFNHFRERFQQRLAGLGRSHDLLLNRGGANVSLEELVRSHVAAFTEPDDSRLQIAGPALLAGPDAAQHLGMAIHELSTNALKHGAFSTLSGRVRVEWVVRAAGGDRERLRLCWSESGGPAPNGTHKPSFGSLVLEQIVPGGLEAKASLDLRPEGLVWTLDMPLEALA